MTAPLIARARRYRPRLAIPLALTGLLVAACGGSSAEADAAGPDSTAVVVLGARDVAQVSVQPIATGVTITGSLDPADEVEIKSELAGQVQRVTVERGTPVRRGQVLATIDGGAIDAQLASARASLASADRDLGAADTLYKRGAVSERDFVQARVARDAAAAQVAQVRETLSRTTVRSPIDGIVSQRTVQAGEAVQVAAPLFTVVNTTALELAGRVPPDAVARVRVGQSVQLTVDAYPGRVITGRVARVEPVAEAGTRQVGVYVRVQNPGRTLVAGLFATGMILGPGGVTPVPTVPLSAVRDAGGQPAVLAVEASRLVRRPVTLGERDAERGLVEVRSGVQPGTRVVLNPAESLTDGTRVRLLADSAAPSAAVARRATPEVK